MATLMDRRFVLVYLQFVRTRFWDPRPVPEEETRSSNELNGFLLDLVEATGRLPELYPESLLRRIIAFAAGVFPKMGYRMRLEGF